MEKQAVRGIPGFHGTALREKALMRILILLLAIALFLPAICSAENENFTQVIPAGSDDYVHVNTSYTLTKTTTSVPFPVWLIVVIGAFLSLSISLLVKPATGPDLFAWIALLLFITSVYMSFGIDIVTGFGVTSQPEVIAGPDAHEFVYLENHTVYHPESFIILMAMFSGISLVNLFRVRKALKDLDDDENPKAPD